MKRNGVSAINNAWYTFPAVLVILLVLVIRFVHYPLAVQSIYEGKNLYRHYIKKRDAAQFPQRESRCEAEAAQLDSVIKRVEERYRSRERSFIDALYAYADTCAFRTGKIESGIPQPVGEYRETAVSIEGQGAYRAVGAFVEKIENSPQSTRIRQITIKESEKGAPEVFIEVVLREE